MIKWFFIFILLSCARDEAPALAVNGKVPPKLEKNEIARLEHFSNYVKVKHSNQLDWSNGFLNYSFLNYDMVKTEVNSSALIRYSDDSSLKVNENSFVIIVKNENTISRRVKVINLNKGIINGEIKDLDDIENSFEIHTKSGLLKIKPRAKTGNKFKIQLEPTGKLTIQNEQAHIVVLASDKTKVLKVKEKFIISSGVYKIDKKTNLPVISNKSWGAKKKTKILIKSKSPEVHRENVFEIISPTNEQTILSDKVIIHGRIQGYKLLLNGTKVKGIKGVFKTTFPLKKGLNILTFQIIKKDTVDYKVLKVYRK